ncbi:MAG: hypothetical protein U9Q81_16970 [Pseudomonadota bacterium]|nr:hypothetical protein [Pseudomonadota bacterium]
MKLKRFYAPLMGAFLLVLTQPSLAEDPFHISYRQQNLSSDGLTQSGMLLVTVVNVSGEDVQEIMASVPGPNNVTYDNRSILVGDLAEAAQTEVLDEFQVPQELANPDAMEDNITWQVEYTDSTGERLSIEVRGEKVPH